MQKEKVTPATLAHFHSSELSNVQTFYPTVTLKECFQNNNKEIFISGSPMWLGGRTTGMKETSLPYWWVKETILKSNLAETEIHFMRGSFQYYLKWQKTKTNKKTKNKPF